MSISVEFQERFQDLVDESERKRTHLAKEMGIDYRSFSNALNYGIIPKPIVLARIADYYNIPIDYLLGLSENDSFEKAKFPGDFHTRYEDLRKEKGVTNYRVAIDCHFDKSCISKWFSLNQIPSFEILDLLRDYFNVSLDYLLGRTDVR